MSGAGFVGLLVLLLVSGAGTALSYVPRYRRVFHYPEGARYVAYHVAGWSSLAGAAWLCWWLWSFDAEVVPDGVVRLGPTSGAMEYLLPLLFVFLGGAISAVIALQLLLCGGVVLPRRGHRRRAAPAGDGGQRDAPIVAVVIGFVVWLPGLIGYELMRDTWIEVDAQQLRRDGFFAADPELRPWSDVARLEYRPWTNSRNVTGGTHHAIAFVFGDGAEWHCGDDDFWSIADEATRERLRAMAAARGVEFRRVPGR